MKAVAELQVIPIGRGVSVRTEIEHAVAFLKQNGFIVDPHASGTDIEGELSEILTAVDKVHQMLHNAGTPRLVTQLKLDTRVDKVETIADKQL